MRARLRAVLAHQATRTALISGLFTGLQGITGLLTARWLGPADRGIVVLAVTISSFAVLLGGLGMPALMRIRLSDPTSGLNYRGFELTALRLSALVAVPVLGGSLAMLSVLGHHPGPWVLACFALYVGGALSAALYREATHGIGHHQAAVVGDLLAAGVLLTGSCGLYVLGHLTVVGFLLSATVGYAVQCAFLRFAGRHERGDELVRPPLRALLASSRSALLWAVLSAFAWKGDRLMLGLVRPPEDVGVYGTAATLSDLAWMAPAAVGAIVARQVAQAGSLTVIPRWRRRLMVVTGACILPVGGIGTLLLTRALGPGYESGVPALWILCLAALALASYQTDISGCQGMGNFHSAWKAALGGSISLAVLAPPLSAYWSGTGCALASFAAYTVMAIVGRIEVTRISKTQSRVSGPFPPGDRENTDTSGRRDAPAPPGHVPPQTLG